MTEGMRRRHEFAEALENVLAKLVREGEERIDRTRVEELGQQYGLDEDEARRVFVDSKGTIWEGEFVETDEEPGWESAVLENIPSKGPGTNV